MTLSVFKPEGSSPQTGFVMFSFAAGAIIGAFVGAFSITEAIPALVAGHFAYAGTARSLAEILWNCGKFHLFSLLCASSLLGVAAIPAIAAVRGYLIACTAAAIYACYPDNGLLINFIVLGLPALISLPCLFIIASDSLTESGRLCAMALGSPAKTQKKVPIIRHSLISISFLTIAALTELTLVPALLSYCL